MTDQLAGVESYKYDLNNGTPVTTRYLYDGPNIVAQYDGSWNVTAKYIHTPDIDDPLTVTQGDNTYYYHRDGLGSVVNLTDSNGYIVKTYTYKSFGEINSETGSLVQPFAFTGREYDPESGLYFYRARYYDPRAGRFLTKDPIGFAGGDVNLYRYVANNPINFVDPLGLSRIVLSPKAVNALQQYVDVWNEIIADVWLPEFVKNLLYTDIESEIESSFICPTAVKIPSKYAGKTIREILKSKKGSIKQAHLEKGTPSWSDILDSTIEEIADRARTNPQLDTILKLLRTGRYDK